jgi:hypothetical protein
MEMDMTTNRPLKVLLPMMAGILCLLMLSVALPAQETGEKTFASAQDAGTTLYDAVKAGGQVRDGSGAGTVVCPYHRFR